MSQPSNIDAPPIRPEAHLRPGIWFVRRALIGIVALTVFVAGGAMLLHASIDQDAEAINDQSQSE